MLPVLFGECPDLLHCLLLPLQEHLKDTLCSLTTEEAIQVQVASG